MLLLAEAAAARAHVGRASHNFPAEIPQVAGINPPDPRLESEAARDPVQQQPSMNAQSADLHSLTASGNDARGNNARGNNGPSINVPGPGIIFWSSSRDFVEAWVHDVPDTPSQRLERLRALFLKDECNPEIDTGMKRVRNIVCTLPGESDDIVLVGAHYNHVGSGAGAVDNWSGAAMLPLLYRAMQATSRRVTYVFAAFDGRQGAEDYLKSRRKAIHGQIRAVLDMDDLGLSPTRSCSFPDNSSRFMQDLELEQVLLGVASSLGGQGMPQRESCYAVIKIDDTDSYRKAGIPTLVIHSVTHEKRSLPGSGEDTPAAIDAVSYYNSYQLLATYLCLIDSHLDAVLRPGAYNPWRVMVPQRAPRSRVEAELPVEVNEAASAAPPLAPPPLPAGGGMARDLMTLDVVAAGQDGSPVEGLKREEIELLVDGASQPIAGFEEYGLGSAAGAGKAGAGEAGGAAVVSPSVGETAAAAAEGRKAGAAASGAGTGGGGVGGRSRSGGASVPAIYSNATYDAAPGARVASVVLLLDTLNTARSDELSERRSMLEYLKTIPPETRVAVFGLGSRLTMFQGVAGDSAELLAAVDRVLEKTRALAEGIARQEGSSEAGGGASVAAGAASSAAVSETASAAVSTALAVVSSPGLSPTSPAVEPAAAPASQAHGAEGPGTEAHGAEAHRAEAHGAEASDSGTALTRGAAGSPRGGDQNGHTNAAAGSGQGLVFSDGLERKLARFLEDMPMAACPPRKHVPRAAMLFVSPDELPPEVDATSCVYSPASRAKYTMEAFRQIARYLGNVGGRKSIVWLADAYPLPLDPEMLRQAARTIGEVNTDDALDYTESMLRLAAQLTSDEISLYPVRASAADRAQADGYERLWGEPAEQRREGRMLAEITGGEAFGSSRQLGQALARAALDDEHYYAVRYKPAGAPSAEDTGFRRVGMKVKGAGSAAGSAVLYRHGYYWGDQAEGSPVTAGASMTAGAVTTAGASMTAGAVTTADASAEGNVGSARLNQLFANALRPGLPPAAEILFNARVRALAVEAVPGQVRYAIEFNARYTSAGPSAGPSLGPSGGVTLASVDGGAAPGAAAGGSAAAVQGAGASAGLPGAARQRLIFAATANDARGKQVESNWKTLEMDASPEVRARQAADGVPFQMEIEAPAEATTLTVGVYDPESRRMGTVDIPLRESGR